jgi:protease-4
MKKAIVSILAIFGGLVVVGLIVILAIGLAFRLGRGGVPAKTILEVNLETELLETIPDDPVAAFLLKDAMTLRDVVDALEKAGDDSRVVGLIARVGVAPLGMAKTQEIRDAVQAFRAKKKWAVAYSETFGEFGPGNGAYYLATAFDEIWLQPSGDVGLTGLMIESPFLRGTLDKLGIKPRMDHRYEYKNAMNFFTEKKYTPAHKEANSALMNSWFSQIRRGIVEGRRMTDERVMAAVNRGPLLGQEAMDAGLVDGVAYRDEVYEKVKEKGGKGAELLYLRAYLKRAGRPHTSGQTIALIYGVGAVARGEGGYDPVTGDTQMGSQGVAGAFRAAIEDKKVKAIIFRVDSPGGSYVASDTIWRETVRARKAGKPVIVTMGNLAGSGGYFVAMSADKIVAQPGTITASIGVVAGKMLTTGFWDKLGLSWDEVHVGENANIWTGTHDYSDAQWARFQQWLDRIYDDFTSKVAEGRSLPKEKVLEIAKGRIWTGEDAKNLGLVDELGGYATAVRLAKQAAKIPEKEDVKIQIFPRKKSPLEMILGEPPDSSEPEKAALQALASALREIQPAVRTVKRITTGAHAGVLSMPEPVPTP